MAPEREGVGDVAGLRPLGAFWEAFSAEVHRVAFVRGFLRGGCVCSQQSLLQAVGDAFVRCGGCIWRGKRALGKLGRTHGV